MSVGKVVSRRRGIPTPLSDNLIGSCYMRVYAGIVTFNPELDRLKENINAIAPQVERVIVFDNGSKNIEELRTILPSDNSMVTLFENGRNVGMARALNSLCRMSGTDGADQILLLDQDSVVPEGFVGLLARYASDGVGIVAPYIVDRNNVKNYPMDEPVEHVLMAITSGALLSIAAWEEVGGYDENLFVDWVDYDFCDNLTLHGLEILKIREAALLHEMGKKEFSHMGWSFNLKRGFFRWPVYHDDRPFSRRYDVMKAHVYVSLKYRWTRLWGHEVWYLTYDILRNLIRERKKMEFLRALSKGAIDGSYLAFRARACRGHANLVSTELDDS